ncbi:MerR family transcriptional regulator [Mobilitalea sibirica]|uniref:MerR family transcriptional regulator n=1 Tax=Mobilitalea sibirica TaxID=1462919 RepID=A0A8J7H138_9FIRM|nr:MerR family transcriptional regulator [Mobilitalea sibirica]MBH1939962.1 MerR family transcriptional regulator [Mobilitalea sibirica]
MQIHEMCHKTGLTKKAIEYYQVKGLISPKIYENGYREFSDKDLSILNEVAMLRKLDLGIEEIKQVLDSNDRKRTLTFIKHRKEMEVKAKSNRLDLLEQLINGADNKEISDKLDLLDHQSTMKERLLAVFPGYYGRYLSLHFGYFLNEPLRTNEKKRLFNRVVEVLDNMESIEIPKDLQTILDEINMDMNDENINQIINYMQNAYDDIETYMDKNNEQILKYEEFKKSNEYESSIMSRLLNLYRKFGETSGYYDEFIPIMRKLSPAYDDYYRKMLEANEKFKTVLIDKTVIEINDN